MNCLAFRLSVFVGSGNEGDKGESNCALARASRTDARSEGNRGDREITPGRSLTGRHPDGTERISHDEFP
jgi:hypothetical protein